MKKLISVIPIAILISILLSNKSVFADTGTFIRVYPADGGWSAEANYFDSPFDCHDTYITSTAYHGIQWDSDKSVAIQKAINSYNTTSVHWISRTYYFGSNNQFILLSGTLLNYNSDYVIDQRPTPTPTPTPTPIPKWYEGMWDTLQEELGNPSFWFGEWFIDIIDQVFGNEEEPSQGPSRISDSTHIKQISPTPAPTPIPYSTITVPRTDIINNTTVYETQYVYTSSSGDTIIATAPPTNPPSQNPSGGSSGGGSDYNPIDPYSIPEVSWFTSAEIGDTSYDGIDSIMQGFDSIDTIGSEYTEGMSVVEDSMGTLPISWLLLIGIASAIPLIAGIISRFLS